MASMRFGLTQILLGILVLTQLFFLVTGPVTLAPYWQQANLAVWMPIYLIINLATFAMSVFVGGQGAYAPASPFGDPFGFAPYAALLFVGGFIVVFAIFQFPGFRVPLNLPSGSSAAAAEWIITTGTFTEEIAFRWFAIPLFQPITGTWGAIIASSAAWAGFHLLVYGEQPVSLLFIFGMGIVFGFAYVATRKLAGVGLVWGAHAGWNLAVAGLLTVVH